MAQIAMIADRPRLPRRRRRRRARPARGAGEVDGRGMWVVGTCGCQPAGKGRLDASGQLLTPNSTPLVEAVHIPQYALVNTLCSYASSAPSVRGLSASSRITLSAGCRQSSGAAVARRRARATGLRIPFRRGLPSGVRPIIKACAWAMAVSHSNDVVGAGGRCRGCARWRRSRPAPVASPVQQFGGEGVLPLMPLAPHTTGLVARPTGWPSRVVCLPLLSMSSLLQEARQLSQAVIVGGDPCAWWCQSH